MGYLPQSMVSFWDWDATFTGVRYAKLHLHILYWACFNQSSRRRVVVLDRKFSSSFWHILIQPLSFIHPLQMFTRKCLCAPSSIYSWHKWQGASTFAFAVLSDLVCQDVWFYYFRTILWVQTGCSFVAWKRLDSLSHSLYSHSDTCSLGACTCRWQDWKKDTNKHDTADCKWYGTHPFPLPVNPLV